MGAKFDGWTTEEWSQYIQSLNKELSPEECGMELNIEEKEAYIKSLEWLKNERANNPGIPISYDLGAIYRYFD